MKDAGHLVWLGLLALVGCQSAGAEMATVRLGVPSAKPEGVKYAAPLLTGYVVEAKTAPKVDGVLDDAAWKQASPVSMRSVTGKGAVTAQTQVLLLHHGRRLYIGVRMEEPDVDKLRRKVTQRDGPAYTDDSVELFISPKGGSRWCQFVVGAGGALYDSKDRNRAWNSSSRHAVAVGKKSWSLELAIPFSALDVGEGAPKTWRANFYRNRRAGKDESSAWSPTFRSDYDVPARFGRLAFTEPPPAPAEGPPLVAGRAAAVLPVANGEAVVRFDLSSLPKGARIHRADLLVFRTEAIDGAKDEALAKIEIFPLFGEFKAGGKAKASGKPLTIRGPWYDRLDATAAVRQFAGKPTASFFVKVCPLFNAKGTCLDIAYEGKPGKVPPQAKGLRVFHRAGQTFITWKEIESPFGDRPVTLAQLKAKRTEMEKARRVRYWIYCHHRPISRGSVCDAELLAEVVPFSGYNIRGVSVDRLIYQHQIRARDDDAFARSIARGPFRGYHRGMHQMGEVVVDRLAIDDGKPLAPGVGLYVHHPVRLDKVYYAVVSSVDGVANTRHFSSANSLRQPVDEKAGRGVPVFQGLEKLKVFYDYPGERRRYVQWCAPPLASLPNQYHNWGVYLPPAALAGAETEAPLALGVYFHDWRGLYLRPHWPHTKDMVLISPDDGYPRATFGYGYHESLGTLRAFSKGAVHDYTARRIDAFVEWASGKFRIDRNRMSCHGSGVYGGTSAVAYALRHPRRVALVVAGAFDADPKSNPRTLGTGHRRRQTHLRGLEAVWGKKEWDLKTADGKSIWQDRDLVAFVRRNPNIPLPFMSLGTGSQHATWPQENALMKALWKSKQPFFTDFTWGGQAPRFGWLNARRDSVILAAVPTKATLSQQRWYNDARWQKAARGYWAGGQISSGAVPTNVADTPDRLELTAQISGHVTIRNAQRFKLKPGEQVRWEVKSGRRGQDRNGTATADQNGLLTLPGFRGRLLVTRMAAEPTKTVEPKREGAKK